MRFVRVLIKPAAAHHRHHRRVFLSILQRIWCRLCRSYVTVYLHTEGDDVMMMIAFLVEFIDTRRNPLPPVAHPVVEAATAAAENFVL